MTAFVACRGHRPLLFPVLGCLAVAFAASRLPKRRLPPSRCRRAPSASRSRFVSTRPAAQAAGTDRTLVVGNPLIADAAVQSGGVVVVTGKSYGMTNLVALDRTGAMLVEYPIR